MTPQFTERIDPIFRQLFQLLDRIDQGQAVRHEEIRESLVQQLSEVIIEGDAPQRKALEWRRAIYGLTCWIDEMLIDAYEWPGKAWWKDHPLERDPRLFGTMEANSQFYREDLLASSEDAMESFYVCALLGFQGLYGSDNNVNSELKAKLDLPRQRGEWVESRRRRIREYRDDQSDSTQAAPRQIIVAKPLWKWAWAWLPWVFAWILLWLVMVSAKL